MITPTSMLRRRSAARRGSDAADRSGSRGNKTAVAFRHVRYIDAGVSADEAVRRLPVMVRSRPVAADRAPASCLCDPLVLAFRSSGSETHDHGTFRLRDDLLRDDDDDIAREQDPLGTSTSSAIEVTLFHLRDAL